MGSREQREAAAVSFERERQRREEKGRW